MDIKLPTILPLEYHDRMNMVLTTSWTIFKSQFINERYYISKEAPFQHHFANIIGQVGNLFCLTRDDFFRVDLETKCDNVKGKPKYVDITCEFVNKINCAVELKYKKNSQGAQDHGRIDIYTDIEALEIVSKNKFDIGRFFAITDSTPYIHKSKVGIGTVFPTHHGHETKAGEIFISNSKGRDGVIVELTNSYKFDWEKIDKTYFLDLEINMSTLLEKLAKRDPNWIADDDHLDRKDLTEKEVDQCCKELKEKFGMKDGYKKPIQSTKYDSNTE
jgi:hypothetical protein